MKDAVLRLQEDMVENLRWIHVKIGKNSEDDIYIFKKDDLEEVNVKEWRPICFTPEKDKEKECKGFSYPEKKKDGTLDLHKMHMYTDCEICTYRKKT